MVPRCVPTLHPRPRPPAPPTSRASKSWLDRFLTSSMGTFNEFAAYNSDAPAPGPGSSLEGQPGASGDMPPPAPPAEQPAAGQPQQLRDIVTGELLPAGGPDAAPAPAAPPAPGHRPLGGSASGKLGVKPPRDIRLEPVQQIASWLGSQPAPRPRQQPDGSGGKGDAA